MLPFSSTQRNIGKCRKENMDLYCWQCLDEVAKKVSKDLRSAYTVIDGRAVCLTHFSEAVGWDGSEIWNVIDRLRKG